MMYSEYKEETFSCLEKAFECYKLPDEYNEFYSRYSRISEDLELGRQNGPYFKFLNDVRKLCGISCDLKSIFDTVQKERNDFLRLPDNMNRVVICKGFDNLNNGINNCDYGKLFSMKGTKHSAPAGILACYSLFLSDTNNTELVCSAAECIFAAPEDVPDNIIANVTDWLVLMWEESIINDGKSSERLFKLVLNGTSLMAVSPSMERSVRLQEKNKDTAEKLLMFMYRLRTDNTPQTLSECFRFIKANAQTENYINELIYELIDHHLFEYIIKNNVIVSEKSRRPSEYAGTVRDIVNAMSADNFLRGTKGYDKICKFIRGQDASEIKYNKNSAEKYIYDVINARLTNDIADSMKDFIHHEYGNKTPAEAILAGIKEKYPPEKNNFEILAMDARQRGEILNEQYSAVLKEYIGRKDAYNEKCRREEKERELEKKRAEEERRSELKRQEESKRQEKKRLEKAERAESLKHDFLDMRPLSILAWSAVMALSFYMLSRIKMEGNLDDPRLHLYMPVIAFVFPSILEIFVLKLMTAKGFVNRRTYYMETVCFALSAFLITAHYGMTSINIIYLVWFMLSRVVNSLFKPKIKQDGESN